MNRGVHTSVLLKEVIEGLALTPDMVVVDATINGGGHSEVIANDLSEKGILIGIDMDENALTFTRERLADSRATVLLKQGNNRDLDTFLREEGITQVDRFFFDLGMSSWELDHSNRGFSFRRNEPLIMTFASHPKEEDLTAGTIVNEWEEESIADILKGYGEERFARRIARNIVTRRAKKPITTTNELVAVIEEAVPSWYRHKRIHPATKTFQALRITVNDEIRSVHEALLKAGHMLGHKGRILVIAFHSIEDRIVKNTFKKWKSEGQGIIVTKKPITPSEDEAERNPRARSAKLRIFERI